MAVGKSDKLQLAEEFGCHEVVIWWDKVGSGQRAVGKSDKLQPVEKYNGH